jgi:(hydroxyamino)benzene mutase
MKGYSMATQAQAIVCFSGILLFVLGLLNGAVIPLSKSPRLSLSAHLTAVQSGTFLVAIAWAWPRLDLSATNSATLAWMISGSMIILWFAFCLAGFWGAGRGLTIAGVGADTSSGRQLIVTALLGIGVTGTLLTCAALLYLWKWP